MEFFQLHAAVLYFSSRLPHHLQGGTKLGLQLSQLSELVLALLFEASHPFLEFPQFSLQVVQLKVIIFKLLCQECLNVLACCFQILSNQLQLLLKAV